MAPTIDTYAQRIFDAVDAVNTAYRARLAAIEANLTALRAKVNHSDDDDYEALCDAQEEAQDNLIEAQDRLIEAQDTLTVAQHDLLMAVLPDSSFPHPHTIH